MTPIPVVVLVAVMVVVAVTWTCMWVTARLGQPAPGTDRDGSRGTGRGW